MFGVGLDLIAKERARQVNQEGYDSSHDARYKDGELTIAAACYAVYGLPHDFRVIDADIEIEVGPMSLTASLSDAWPWDEEFDKRTKHDRVRRLVIAGALIAAELDRIYNEPPQASRSGVRPEITEDIRAKVLEAARETWAVEKEQADNKLAALEQLNAQLRSELEDANAKLALIASCMT